MLKCFDNKKDKETRMNDQVSAVLRKLVEQSENIKLKGSGYTLYSMQRLMINI